jgi:hypothetical protein
VFHIMTTEGLTYLCVADEVGAFPSQIVDRAGAPCWSSLTLLVLQVLRAGPAPSPC